MVNGFVFRGTPAGDYKNNRIKTAAKLKEGSLIYDKSGFSRTGRTAEYYHVSAPLHIGQFVKISADSAMNEQFVVEKAENSEQAHGRLINYPNIRADIGWKDDELDGLPQENAEWGNYTPRSATIEWFAETIGQFKVKNVTDGINAGDHVTITPNDQTGEMEVSKTDKVTNWIAMEKINQNTPGEIRVLCIN